MRTLTQEDAARFWKQVEQRDDNECWPWTSGSWMGDTTHRYGAFAIWPRKVGAHRIAYELANGSIPPGAIVRHRCDNPLCCNPAHLEAGTHADNARDREARRRGRWTKGPVVGLVALLIGAASLSTTTAAAQHQGAPCSGNRHYEVHAWMTTTVQHRHVRALIGCAVDRWAVPGGYDKALSVAQCESSLYAHADNGHGDLGIYQISSWDTRARTYLKRWWFPRHPFPPRWALARANVLTAIVWVHRARSWQAWACS